MSPADFVALKGCELDMSPGKVIIIKTDSICMNLHRFLKLIFALSALHQPLPADTKPVATARDLERLSEAYLAANSDKQIGLAQNF